jgi:hypothetical protein
LDWSCPTGFPPDPSMSMQLPDSGETHKAGKNPVPKISTLVPLMAVNRSIDVCVAPGVRDSNPSVKTTAPKADVPKRVADTAATLINTDTKTDLRKLIGNL